MTLPTLFLAHGSPMNALGGNAHAEWLNRLGQELPRPRGIVIVSAHWQTAGAQVLDLPNPPTIHDFYGFPPELYRIQYSAPGSAAITDQVVQALGPDVRRSEAWGFDHGTWSVLRHMYPQADIPVVQLSLDSRLTLQQHFELGRKLRPLREEGLLLLGSGNLVHNLSRIDFHDTAAVFPWAKEADKYFASAIRAKDAKRFVDFAAADPELMRLAIPTPEHYQPLLYVMGASFPDEAVSFPFEEIQNGSISMRSVRVG